MSSPRCSVCIKKGIFSKLTLKQINFTAAVYLCSNPQCSYPEEDQWIIVERKLEDAFTTPKTANSNNAPILHEVREIKAENGPTQMRFKAESCAAKSEDLMQELDTIIDKMYVDQVQPAPNMIDVNVPSIAKQEEDFQLDQFLSQCSDSFF